MFNITAGNRARFWSEDNDGWGLGDNVALGFVSNNFEDFINSLRPDPLRDLLIILRSSNAKRRDVQL